MDMTFVAAVGRTVTQNEPQFSVHLAQGRIALAKRTRPLLSSAFKMMKILGTNRADPFEAEKPFEMHLEIPLEKKD